MKRLILIALSIFLCLSSWAQGTGEVFSKEDIKWKPEFTVRTEVTIPGFGYMASLGVRINDKWTVGLMPGFHETHHDADMVNEHSFSANVYVRRYFHLGPQQRVSFFVDGLIGADINQKVEHVFDKDFTEVGRYAKGATYFNAAIEPGVRLRIYKNIHIFTGPLFGTRYFGLHLGAGF